MPVNILRKEEQLKCMPVLRRMRMSRSLWRITEEVFPKRMWRISLVRRCMIPAWSEWRMQPIRKCWKKTKVVVSDWWIVRESLRSIRKRMIYSGDAFLMWRVNWGREAVFIFVCLRECVKQWGYCCFACCFRWGWFLVCMIRFLPCCRMAIRL